MKSVTLEQLIAALHFKYHICIHDVDQVMICETLFLPNHLKIHDVPFCNQVKRIGKNHQSCLRHKDKLIAKAAEIKQPFVDTCHFGVRQLIYPVLINGVLRCVIYFYTENGGELEQDFDSICIWGKIIENHILLLSKEAESNQKTLSKTEWTVNKMLEDIETGFSTKMTLQTEGEKLFYNPKYLGQIFKKKTGKTFHAALNQKRLETANYYLKNTDKTVLEISQLCGYENVTHFNRVYKKTFGFSPKK